MPEIQRLSGNTPLENGGFRNSSPLPSSEVPNVRRRRLVKASAFFYAVWLIADGSAAWTSNPAILVLEPLTS